MVFDSGRRVAVVFGGNLNTSPGGPTNDTWEYTVKSLANGEGCTAASASTCASGQCVDGVCCETAGCTGACMACNVRGSEGKCVLAQAGTEVPDSCSKGQACDGSGACKSKNGQACTDASQCASGFCTDGVCCNLACNGTCMACNLTGVIGTCTPYVAGKDLENECGKGTGACASACDGAGACMFPLGLSCGTCLVCDGTGTCTRPDPACGGTGGTGGKDSGATKPIPGSGGVGGSVKSSGGEGGKSIPGSGGMGGIVSSSPVNSGGVGGIPSSPGGRGGSVSSSPVNSSGNIGGASGGLSSSPGGQGGSNNGGAIGGDGGTHPSSSGGQGGGVNTNDGGLARDAGARSSGQTPGDAGAPDAGLVGRLSSRGCSCALGQVAPSGPSPLWALLLGASLLALRARRRK
jgi:MYXO-CTERM domain-containing protein